MQDRCRVALEELGERLDVDGKGIHERDEVVDGELHERDLRVVRALPMELGVDRVCGRAREMADHVGERVVRGDPADGGLRHAPVTTGSGGLEPVTTSLPARTHARVPPATFTASICCSARKSAAIALRLPLRQMM